MSNDELNQPVTKKYLGEFTETILLPAVSNILDEKLKDVHKEIKDVQGKMVTKTFLNETLDEKLADLTGDLTVLMRKEDRKLLALVEILKGRKVISAEDAKQILALEPFPKA